MKNPGEWSKNYLNPSTGTDFSKCPYAGSMCVCGGRGGVDGSKFMWSLKHITFVFLNPSLSQLKIVDRFIYTLYLMYLLYSVLKPEIKLEDI